MLLEIFDSESALLKGKQLTRNSTWRSCDVCVNQFAEKDGEKWRGGDGILHYDDAPAHTSHLVQQFFGQKGHRSVAAAAIITGSRTV